MSNVPEAIPSGHNNQIQPAVVNTTGTINVSLVAVDTPSQRKRWIFTIALCFFAVLLIAATGIIVNIYSTNETNVTSITILSTTMITTTINTILLENTSVTYINITLPTAMCPVHSITMADINNDGKIDLIHPDCYRNQISILFNDGNGIFTKPTNYSTGDMPSYVTIGDMNADEKNDIIITNQISDNVGIFYNMGYDTFTDQYIYSTNPGPCGVALIDLNNDHFLDIVIAISTGDYLDILMNTGDKTYSEPMPHFLGLEPLVITAIDINNDNKLDIIVGIAKQQGPLNEYYIDIFFNTGNRNFTEHTRLKTRDVVYSIAVADINGDNALDVIVASHITNIDIFFNTGNNTFNTKKIVDTSGFIVTKVATGDIDGDTKIDIIFASALSNKIGILYNIDNSATFNCLTTFPVHSPINYLTIADINSDKKLDIIVGTPNGILILSLHYHPTC